MKKLSFLLIALLMSVSVFSQSSPAASGVVVHNQTSCTQYYMIFGDEECVCGSVFASPIKAILPGDTHTYPSSMALGGSFPASVPKGIVGAKTLDGPVGCSAGGGTVGQMACGLPSSYAFLAISANCSPCNWSKVAWSSANTCSSKATLLFY